MPDELRGGRAAAPLLASLTVVAALSPFASDSYLAAFPAMVDDLGASQASIQLTLTAYLLGLGGGTFLLGPISDGIGRRVFLVSGPLVFTAASLLAAVAPGLELLTCARVVQGIAVAGTVVAARAMISDRFGAATSSRQFAIVIGGGHLAPLAAALLGGAAVSVGGWRGVFIAMAGVGVVFALIAFLSLAESLPAAERHGTSLRDVSARAAALLRHGPYRIVLIASLLAMAAHLSNVSSSSFVFQTVLGIDRGFFIAIFAINSAGMVASNLIYAAVASRVSAPTALRVALTIALVSAVVLLVGLLAGARSVAFIWGCLFTFASCMGVVLATTVTIGQSAGFPYQGTAAALQSGCSFLAGAIVSPIAGLFGGQIIIALSVVLIVLIAAGLAVFSLYRSASPSPSPQLGEVS